MKYKRHTRLIQHVNAWSSIMYHASNELGCLNLRELNFKIIYFKAKNNSPNLRLEGKRNECN